MLGERILMVSKLLVESWNANSSSAYIVDADGAAVVSPGFDAFNNEGVNSNVLDPANAQNHGLISNDSVAPGTVPGLMLKPPEHLL